MSKEIKKTKGVLRMREVFEKILMDMGEELLDISRYITTSCSTCIHNEKSVEELPCSKCSTALPKHERDYRPSDMYYWSPTMDASIDAIKAYYLEFGIPPVEMLKEYPPVRCINPLCQDHSIVYDRGLCVDCFDVLDEAVVLDEKPAEEWLLRFWLCDSEEERTLSRKYYLMFYTWYRFETEGKCLPHVVSTIPDKELILYYRQLRDNKTRKKNDITPTVRQLSRIMTEEQLEAAKSYLDIKK